MNGHENDGQKWMLASVHSITNHFVGLSTKTPIALYTFPYDAGWEATPTDTECASRQSGVSERMAAGFDVPPHDHEFYEITVVREGSAVHSSKWGTTPVRKGTVIVVPPGESHTFTELEGFVQTNIYYQSEWLTADLMVLMKQEGLVPLFLASGLFNHPAGERTVVFQLDDKSMNLSRQEMRDICDAASSSPPAILLLNICFIKLLIVLSRVYSINERNAGTLCFRPETWTLLQEVEESLLSQRPFSLSGLAERIGLSTRQLSLKFLRDVGRRPADYLVRRRVQHAARLLLTTNDSVTGIAHGLGFTDSSHLYKQFTELYGFSPKDYRKRFTPQTP